MALVSMVKFETGIKQLKDVNPVSVKAMLYTIRTEIGRVDPYFADRNLAEVLAVVESGTYQMNGSIAIRIDLSPAKSVIKTYREHSEGGCRSCLSLARRNIPAIDASSGLYCKVSDPDYDTQGDRLRAHICGLSPKVKRHYESACDAWTPGFSPKLEELVKNK